MSRLLHCKSVALSVAGELHIASEVAVKGHSAGEFVINESVIDQMIANFGRVANDVVIDYEHDSVSDRNGPHPAAGWIKSLEKRAGEDGKIQLWAKVEWTDAAAEMIKGGQYKYCSPVIDYEAIDRVSAEDIGVELFNCAVTNNPFLDGQTPIALSRRVANTARVQMADTSKQEETKPKADETAAEEPKKAASAKAAEDTGADYAAAFDLIGEGMGADRDQAFQALMANLDAVVAACKGSAANAELSRDAVNAATAPLATVIDVLKAEVVELRRDANDRSERELTSKIDRLVADKCLLPKNRESARVALRNDPKFEEILRGATRVVPVLQGENDGEDNAEERAVRELSKGQQKKYQSLRRLARPHAEALATAKRWVKDDAASAA